jgi:hypothetical protein
MATRGGVIAGDDARDTGSGNAPAEGRKKSFRVARDPEHAAQNTAERGGASSRVLHQPRGERCLGPTEKRRRVAEKEEKRKRGGGGEDTHMRMETVATSIG